MNANNPLAHYILAAAKAHEASYDKEASAKAMTESEKLPEGDMGRHVDFSQFQKLNIFQATCTVVPVDYQMPVYLLLQNSWNDALDWANRETDNVVGQYYAFNIVFEPDTADAVKTSYQIFAISETAAAFMAGQIFAEKFSVPFTIERSAEIYELVEGENKA